jgi:hypothetical protein
VSIFDEQNWAVSVSAIMGLLSLVRRGKDLPIRPGLVLKQTTDRYLCPHGGFQLGVCAGTLGLVVLVKSSHVRQSRPFSHRGICISTPRLGRGSVL